MTTPAARLAQLEQELPALRAKIAELYREAALALGAYYRAGQEAGELANKLASRLGDGSVYYGPELRRVLEDAKVDPNPLPALKDAGYRETVTFHSWRRRLDVVPLEEETQ